MDRDRLLVVLYNAIIMLQEQGFSDRELLEELGMTEEEYDEIFDGSEYEAFFDDEEEENDY
jgi:hypothetical protein